MKGLATACIIAAMSSAGSAQRYERTDTGILRSASGLVVRLQGHPGALSE
jgi:hypothetical protein